MVCSHESQEPWHSLTSAHLRPLSHEQAAVALTEVQQETLASEAAAMVQRLAALAQRHQALLSNVGSLKPQSPVAWRPDAARAVRPLWP